MPRLLATATAALPISMVMLFVGAPPVAAADRQSSRAYVGSAACAECHEAQYERFQKYAKKAHSFASVEKMSKGLTGAELRGCFACHTTGYGQPGGFRSAAETPHLKDVGCESCHGPGSGHVQTALPADIKGRVTTRDCEPCHNEARIEAFGFKPLVFGGAH